MITVIIPSYNRAHLLERIIPSYAQNHVSKIILVDDASTDNTPEVVTNIQKYIPILDYIRLQINSKQAFAKNVAIEKTDTEWIYFGDDDSILMPYSIERLLETCILHNADICGAKALYQSVEEDLSTFVIQNDIVADPEIVANIKDLTAKFNYSVQKPSEVSFTQASALVKTKLAKEIMFDTNYIGNCYREETDFFIRCKLSGAKIYYNSDAVQVNLPRILATGGSHSSGKIKWYFYTIINNHYFMKKNWRSVRKSFSNVLPRFVVETKFILSLFYSAITNLIRRLIKTPQ